ncbi:MAG: hypothetical protein AVDCRST_MAG93-7586, partial [uncultured Chloroflexia bacterium]
WKPLSSTKTSLPGLRRTPQRANIGAAPCYGRWPLQSFFG